MFQLFTILKIKRNSFLSLFYGAFKSFVEIKPTCDAGAGQEGGGGGRPMFKRPSKLSLLLLLRARNRDRDQLSEADTLEAELARLGPKILPKIVFPYFHFRHQVFHFSYHFKTSNSSIAQLLDHLYLGQLHQGLIFLSFHSVI